MNFDDKRRRADAVRGIPLPHVLSCWGAVRDRRDKRQWRTAVGPLSVTGAKFTNWHRQVGGGGAIDLVMHLGAMDFLEAVAWLERHCSSHAAVLFASSGPTPSAPSSKQPESRVLQLPVPDHHKLEQVRRYLTDQRCLEASMLDLLLAEEKIYADWRGNAVFLMVGAIVTGANFADTVSRGFTKEQLYSTASYQAKDLRGIQLIDSDLTDWNFSGQNLSEARFVSSILTGVNLIEAVVNGIYLENTTSRGFTREQLYSTASYQARNLHGISLRENNLAGWDFSGQNLTGASLSWANLTGATLAGANLSNASLRGADLTDVDLSNTNLVGADLRDAFDFSPVASTETRNAIMPDGTILGLELRAGEHLSVADGGGEIFVSERFELADDSILEMRVSCWWGCYHGHLVVAPDVPVMLGGTFRVVGERFVEMQTYDFFDWPGPLEPDHVFSSLELPAGAWDVSQLYTEGQITLTDYYREDGDFDVNGSLDADDLDRLTIAVRAGRDLSYDVNSDGRLDESDRLGWVHDLAGTYFGDTNFDGKVDFTDFLALSSAFGQEGGWAEGDFDGSGMVEFPDFLALSANFGDGVSVDAAAVPEPIGSMLATFGMLGLIGLLQRRHVTGMTRSRISSR